MAKAKISDEDYKAALETVAAAESQTLSGVKEILQEARDAMIKARDKLAGLRDGLPTATGPASPARSNLDGWYNQANSFEQQTGYMIQSLDSIMGQYNAAPMYPTGMAPTL